MLNIEKHRDRLENYEIPLDCYIREIREKCKEENESCGSKRCVECRKENLEWLCSEYQILDDAEKRYLRCVISPFRNEVKSIFKLFLFSEQSEQIAIQMQNDRGIFLPCFEKGTMYKGMVTNKEYTLEELGL